MWLALPDGQFHDYLLEERDIPSLVEDWADGRLGTFNGVELTVEWLDEGESARVREELGVPTTK